MTTKAEVIHYCLTLPNTYEDNPFHDPNWTVMRIKQNQRCFAFVFERMGHIWVNVKCDPEWILLWRQIYASVLPGYHLNKKYWNSLILDGTILEKDIKRMIAESYDLVSPKKP